MRFIAALIVALSGCSAEIAVVPQNGQARAVATSGPITMTAFAEGWSGEPDDLTEYITPIAVELYNAGPYEVRVSYADFALRDERGFRYAAINPFIPAQLGELDNGVMLASRGSGGMSGGGRGWRSAPAPRSSGSGSGHVVVGPPSGRRYGGAVGSGSGGWSGYRIYGGLGGYYGAGYSFWRDPLLYPPWYGTVVFWWGPRYYPSPRPSRDVIDNALPEGVLEPGGHVNGFLYFQKATDRAHSLDLGWEAYSARTNAFVGATHLPLQVVER